MSDLPLHSALVHVPLGLAAVMPLVVLGLLLAIARGWLPARSFALAVGLQLVLVAGAIASQRTGEAEEERVEQVVAEEKIEAHEEMAEPFLVGSIVTLVIGAGALLLRAPRAAAALRLVTGLGTIVVLALALRVGHSGGELVFVHGAANAPAADGTR